MLADGQATKWRRNIVENFNRLSTAHERYRRQTDDKRQTDGRQHIATFAKRERELTFANVGACACVRACVCSVSVVDDDYILEVTDHRQVQGGSAGRTPQVLCVVHTDPAAMQGCSLV